MTSKTDYTYRNAQECFRRAITEGRLSKDPMDPNYAGNYLYMGTWHGQDTFKHYNNREYDV